MILLFGGFLWKRMWKLPHRFDWRPTMKNLLLTTFLFQLLLCFFSCENRNVESEKIIYSEELIAHVGDFKMCIPDGCNFAYDEIQGKIWFHRGLYHSSEFFLVSSSGMIEKSFVIDYEDGSPVTGGGGPGFFVSDNIALVCEGLFKKPHFFLVDLEKQSYRLAKVDADYVLLSDFYDNKLFVTVLDGGLGFYDFMTEEFNNVETDLHGYGFMKKANSFVGMNKRGNVVIQKFGTGDKKELKIRGLKTDNGNGFIRDRY